MTDAARQGLRLQFVGGGTQPPPRRAPTDAVLHTGKMQRILEYAPADMVLVSEAGVTLSQLQAAAREHGQMLALDPPLPERATVGGVVASGAFGPRRARYGAVRDLILGVTLVRADGVVARGGGKVVKNVAGFDLPKVVCGSMGTLGLVATATFRLHPLPDARATAVMRASGAKIAAMVGAMRAAQLEPSSVVALRGEDGSEGGPLDGAFDVAVVFEGFARGVEEQFARLRELADAGRLVEETEFWQRHDAVRKGGPFRVRLGALPSRLPALEATLAPLLGSLGGGAFAWYATLGLGFVAGVPSEATGAALASARTVLAREGGWAIVEASPDAGLDLGALDPWGSTPEAFGLMRQLKQRFDPQGRLNPGCFVGGL